VDAAHPDHSGSAVDWRCTGAMHQKGKKRAVPQNRAVSRAN
jgi:hypothetical protein